MNENIERLIQLQKLDTAILSGRMRIDALREKADVEKTGAASSGHAYEKAVLNIRLLEKKKREKEIQTDELLDRKKKLLQKSSEIKTNEAYQAHLKEIHSADLKIFSLENEQIAIMEQIEAAEKNREEEEKIDSVEKLSRERSIRMIEEEISRCEEELKTLKSRRKSFVEPIDRSLYDKYMAILRSNHGLAVAEAKNEICLGCNLHIPPQLFVEIKANAGLICCPQCRRFLYFKRDASSSPDVS